MASAQKLNFIRYLWSTCTHKTNGLCTNDNIVIAPITLAAIWAHPILVPYMSAKRHVMFSCHSTISSIWTTLWDVILFLCSLWPIWCTTPFNFSQTNILTVGTGLNSFNTFFVIVFLIFTYVTFKTTNWNK